MRINMHYFSYIQLPSIPTHLEADCQNILCLNHKNSTWIHVKKVAKVAKQLAKHYSIDPQKAYIGGLFHDISAIIQPEDMLKIMKENHLSLDPAEEHYPFLLHQQISAFIAEDYFGIKDQEILSAIACHTTLKKEPCPLDMLLFIADKIAWDQEGEPPYLNELKASLLISLEKACQTYIDYLFNEGKLLYPHQNLIEACQYFRKKSSD